MELFDPGDHYQPATTPGLIDADQFASPHPQPLDTPDRIAWLSRQIRAITRDRARAATELDDEINRLTELRTSKLGAVDIEIERLSTELVGYHGARVRDGGPRTVDLPGGRVTGRRPSAKVTVVDPEAFAEWAMLNGFDLVKVSPSQSKINDHLAGLAEMAKAKVGSDPDLMDRDAVVKADELAGQVFGVGGVEVDADVPGVVVEIRATPWKFTPAK